MRVFLFQSRFHERIRAGIKRSTIRLKARCKPGDDLSLRAWSAMPYRSKQIKLVEPCVPCQKVTPVRLAIGSHARLELLVLDPATNHWHNPSDELLAEIACLEGFDSPAEMSDWFLLNHPLLRGMSLRADWIEWELPAQTSIL